MKNLIFSCLVLFISFSKSHAAVHRVNNTGADADFTTPQEAHDAALSGDTLYIESSPSSYGTLVISKEIHVFGPGYYLAQNQDLQANISRAQIETIRLSSGSSETTIQGMYINQYITNTHASSSFSNVVISRNQISGGIYFSTSSGVIDNVFIIGNEIFGAFNTYYSLRTSGASVKSLVVLNTDSGLGSRTQVSFGIRQLYCWDL